MNKAILIGNLTRDPEMKNTASGISACTFTLAVNRRYANQQGKKEADYINVVAWRQLAELCARYLERGSKAAVVGTIQTRSYDAQDGSKRYVTEVVADEVEFLTVKAGGGNPSVNEVDSSLYTREPMRGNAAEMPEGFEEDPDEELPF